MSGRGRKYMSKRDRACDFCRARKAACRINRAPPCYLCTLHGKECTFLPTSKTSQLISNASRTPTSQELQRSSLSALQAVSPPGGPVYYDDMQLDGDGLDYPGPIVPEGFEDLFEGAGLSLPENFVDGPWMTGLSPGSFMGGSPQAACSPLLMQKESSTCLDTKGVMTPQLLGASGDMDPFLMSHYQYDRSGTFHFKNLNIQSVSSEPNPTQFLLSNPSVFATTRQENGSDAVSATELRHELESLVPKDIGLRLIKLFERIVAPDYPIFCPPGHLNPTITPPYLLASVYLIAEPFTKFDDRLCIDLAYEKPSSAALNNIISKALSYEIHAPKLCVVQTLLLLVIRPYPKPIVLDSAFKWSQHSTLVACAHTLGLHLDPKSWNIPACEISQRRLLSYFIYSTDKWLALSLGRPPLLHYDNWLVTSPTREDLLASSLVPSARSNIMMKAELDSLLERVLAQLYSPRAIDTLRIDYKKTIELTDVLLQDLLSWRTQISAPSSESSIPDQGRPVRLIKTLEMHYHYLHLSICKAILRPFVQQTPNETNGVDFQMAREQARKRAKTCISAAADFIHDLQPEDFETLWPAWSATAFSSICFQIMATATSSINRREANEWVACLHKVRRDMRLKVDVLPCLHLGLLRIDSIFWKGVDNVLHLEEHVRQAFALISTTDSAVDQTTSS